MSMRARLGKALIGTAATELTGSALTAAPRMAPQAFSDWFWRLIGLSLDGTAGLPSAQRTADRALQRHQRVDPAIESLVRRHVVLASAQGFVTNLGGGLAAVVGMPANLAGVIMVQTRLIGCVTHLHGYDLDDPRVRTAAVMCLLGEKELKRHVKRGSLPSVPLAVATAPVHDAELSQQVAKHVLNQFVSDIGGGGLVSFVFRKVPVVGGGVGAVGDARATARVARCARLHLVNRRPEPAPAR
ncbi:MAG: EcsC family protein [Propionibacteriaceae bacterium]|jgi:hypothetical protein|nr:EcsC family protein [Propionibacteriaceae bacterium]